MLDIKKFKSYTTKIKPTTQFKVSGPCSFEIRPMNEFGEIEVSFLLEETVNVDKYKWNTKSKTK